MAQILLPSLFSSQHLKSRTTTAIGLSQPQGWSMPCPGLGRAEEEKEHRAWDQGTQGCSGQLRQGDLFRDVPERATSLLRWDTACVTALSHVCFVTPSHGLGQQSQHAQSCHLAGLHHPHPAHARVASLRTDVTAGPGSSGLIPEQTRHLGIPQPQGCRSTGWHRQCPGRYQARQCQQQSGSRSPLCLETCGAGILPCTPVPCAA